MVNLMIKVSVIVIALIGFTVVMVKLLQTGMDWDGTVSLDHLVIGCLRRLQVYIVVELALLDGSRVSIPLHQQ